MNNNNTVVLTQSDEVLKAFMVVVEKEKTETHRNERRFFDTQKVEKLKEMKSFHSRQAVIDYVASIGKDSKDPRRVKKIFSINEFGVSYEQLIVFKDGVLKLESKMDDEGISGLAE